jgi:uncharacterized protein
MKAVIYSDLHGDIRALERLMAIPADAYFCAGDLVTWARGFDRMGEALKRVSGGQEDHVYVMPGNHESATQIEDFCSRYGFVNFHGKTVELGGVRFAGLGYSTLTPFDTPGEYTEDQFTERLGALAEFKPQVLICHSPPLNTQLDRIKEGLHAGSRAVREFIETHQPEYFACGHIHEAEGVVAQMGSTKAMNVGKKGWVLEV